MPVETAPHQNTPLSTWRPGGHMGPKAPNTGPVKNDGV